MKATYNKIAKQIIIMIPLVSNINITKYIFRYKLDGGMISNDKSAYSEPMVDGGLFKNLNSPPKKKGEKDKSIISPELFNENEPVTGNESTINDIKERIRLILRL